MKETMNRSLTILQEPENPALTLKMRGAAAIFVQRQV
jgi:hypothetical protein